jgi:hypothetical protein
MLLCELGSKSFPNQVAALADTSWVFFVVVFFGGTGVRIQSFMLAK